MLFHDWLILSSMLAGAFVGGFWFPKFPQYLKFIAILFIVTSILEASADYVMIVKEKNNLWIYHFMTLSQFTLLTFCLKDKIPALPIKKAMLVIILFVFLIELGLILTIQTLEQSPSWIRLVTRVLLLLWILMYLNSLLKTDETNPLLQMPAFWICIGILIHFLSFLQVGLMKYLIETDKKSALMWYRFSIWFDVFYYLICTYALCLFLSQLRLKKQVHEYSTTS